MINDFLLNRAKQLNLYGLIAHWTELEKGIEIETLLQWEETERKERSLKNRLKLAKLGNFKFLVDFDWGWPKRCDRELVEELMQLDFIKEAVNIIFLGPNGVGKSTLACNIVYQAVLQGYGALCVTGSQMLNDLTSQDGDNALNRRLKYYANQPLLYIDEIGYLSYSNRHADLLFDIISRRYKKKPTIITTNKPFVEWDQIFPNASCIVSLIDRLIHKSEMLVIEAESYRLKEATEQRAQRKQARIKKDKMPSHKTETSKSETT